VFMRVLMTPKSDEISSKISSMWASGVPFPLASKSIAADGTLTAIGVGLDYHRRSITHDSPN
jgi:hypothetical protein